MCVQIVVYRLNPLGLLELDHNSTATKREVCCSIRIVFGKWRISLLLQSRVAPTTPGTADTNCVCVILMSDDARTLRKRENLKDLDAVSHKCRALLYNPRHIRDMLVARSKTR